MNPYGVCGHTKYEGCLPCVHDAYERGRDDMRVYLMADDENVYAQGYRDGVAGRRDAVADARALGYREGYNDHAKSKAYAEAVYGKYPDGEPTLKDNGDGTITVTLKNYGWVQLTLGGDE